MKPKFVSFKNGCERYLINVNNISSVILSEFEAALITITYLDGSVDEIKVVDEDVEIANNIVDGIIRAIECEDRVYIIGGVGQ